MDNKAEHLLVLCTIPDKVTAERIAARIVNDRLAACVNIVPGIESVYEWEGKIERSCELLLIIKTTASGYANLQHKLEELHPYDVPEIIAAPINAGLPGYLSWISQTVCET